MHNGGRLGSNDGGDGGNGSPEVEVVVLDSCNTGSTRLLGPVGS